MSWDLLQRFFDSDVFNQNPFLSVSYLTRYADHVGIHYVLCNKLRQFPYEDIEFFLPQLCHLILSVDNESMALEEFLLDLCEESVTGALLAFGTCRRVYNKVQHIVFGLGEAARHEKIKENPLPVTLLASFVLASVAVPGLPHWAGPLAVAQGRKPQPVDDVVSENAQPKLARAHTVTAAQANKPRRTIKEGGRVTSAPDPRGSPPTNREKNLPRSRPTSSSGSPLTTSGDSPRRLASLHDLKAMDARLSTTSLPLPEMRSPLPLRPSTPVSAGMGPSDPMLTRRHSERAKIITSQNDMTALQRGKLLRQHYFRCQTQFLTALEDISNRLVVVPKPARLSALRAELALIASDLPAEVDVPVICPPTLVDGSPGKSKHHRIVRLNPAEATVLNSAEKVPYLLMVEILRDDFTFDPDSQDNQRLLATLVSEQGSRKRIFDLSESPSTPTASKTSGPVTEPVVDSVFEPSSGDLVDQPDFSALATHMRTASQMLAQLDATSGKRPKHEVAAIRAKIIASMQSLEEQNFEIDDGQGPTFDLIMAKTTAAQIQSNPEIIDEDTTLDPALNTSAGVERMENDFKTGGLQRKGDRDDPSAAVFGEAWQVKKERIRRSSPYGWMKNWDLVSVIVKTGADLRQEAFACQLIDVCDKIWANAGVGVWVKVMRILVTGESSGLVETITNGVSLHSIKRSLTLGSIESGQNPRRRIATLKDHFVKAFGPPDSEAYKHGVDAFKRSLAAYSVISYILQLKDRHNGNVLIDNEGHIVHIDFGFMLSNSPGSVGFEAAPFKLTHEYVEVLGGIGSPEWLDFKRLCKQAFQALRRSADNIVDLVAMMGRGSKMPCFAAGVTTVTTNLRQRFQLQLSAEDAEHFVETDMIGKSIGSYYTRL
ncbi:Phosphatidylinositol 4-kinase pik1alpha (PI4-kinase)(PtdIns-4-kinase) [Cytospora paraplurivora]|uniref:1-phosphatidylinositol 4-kinase n=1 Tax=Cytospora paraplurivora TaxID=2898453 RepID=A0AAN9YCT5_9PEZI